MVNIGVDPFALLKAGRYAEAVEACTRAEQAGDETALANRGLGLLALGQAEMALSDFRCADERDAANHRGRSDAFLKRIGLCLWLLDRQQEALGVWRDTVSSLVSRRIQFSDAAGGVGTAALLWYAGVRSKNSLERTAAEQAIRRLGKRGLPTAWPQSIGRFLIRSEPETDPIADAVLVGGELATRRACQAHFYVAAVLIEQGRAADAAPHLTAAGTDPTAVVEPEFFLARHELHKTPGSESLRDIGVTQVETSGSGLKNQG